MRHGEVLPRDSAAAATYGPLRADVEVKGSPIGSLDMLSATHALAAGCVPATNDKAFARVPGLVVDDWLAACVSCSRCVRVGNA